MMHESTNFMTNARRRIFKSKKGKLFSNTPSGNKVYNPVAALRGVKVMRRVRSTSGVPMKLRSARA